MTPQKQAKLYIMELSVNGWEFSDFYNFRDLDNALDFIEDNPGLEAFYLRTEPEH